MSSNSRRIFPTDIFCISTDFVCNLPCCRFSFRHGVARCSLRLSLTRSERFKRVLTSNPHEFDDSVFLRLAARTTMELAQLLQASSSVASTPPWAVGGSPAPERKRTETTLDALLNADETASNPAQVDRDDPAFLSAPSQLGKRPRDGDSLLSNSHLESVGSTSLAPGILQNTTTGIYAPYPAFPTTNGLFGQTGQHPPPKLAFGAAASPTAPPRMFGLTVAPSAISMQFAQFPQTHFEYNPVQDPSQPRQATQHDAGVASGSERTLELALAELLSEDRRMLALEAEKQAKSKQRKPTSDDDEPPYEELPDEDDGQDYSYGSQKKVRRIIALLYSACSRSMMASGSAKGERTVSATWRESVVETTSRSNHRTITKAARSDRYDHHTEGNCTPPARSGAQASSRDAGS